MESYKKGADYIVVGRPITKSEDPRKALELFLWNSTHLLKA